MGYFFAGRAFEVGAAFAPMAGLSDRALRQLADEFGAVFTVSEMVSAKALTMNDKKSGSLCAPTGGRGLYGIQLFGCEPETMARAAEIVREWGPDFIDINMGCPAPKVVNTGCGSALMRSPALCEKLVAAAGRAGLPVSVKMRTGYDGEHLNAPEVARACEAGGAALITVHGRTRDQQYTPPIYPEEIARVVQAVRVPVLGNGDILTAQDALCLEKETGCAGVMIGRGALGNLWLFPAVAAAEAGEKAPCAPTLRARLALLKRQVDGMCAEKGEHTALLQARTQAAFYMKGLRGAAHLRALTGSLSVRADLDRLCAAALAENREG